MHDRVADLYLVSNVAGDPSAADGNGFISRVRPDGTVLELRWIDGARPGVDLDAPKGMAIDGDALFVADIKALRKFDRRTGAPLASVEVPGATFLNDVAIGPDGTVWVTDTGDGEPGRRTDAILRFGPTLEPERVAEGPELGQPNGILYGERNLFFVGWESGAFSLLAEDGTIESSLRLPQGRLDGLVRTRTGRWLTSSWAGACIYEIDRRGSATVLFDDLDAPADIGYDATRNRLLIPLFRSDRVVVRAL